MTITLKLKPWVVVDGFKHIETDWQIASDKNFINILDTIENSKENLNIYISKLVLPINGKYYTRARRKLASESKVIKTLWSEPFVIIDTPADDELVVLTNNETLEQLKVKSNNVNKISIDNKLYNVLDVENSEVINSTEINKMNVRVNKDKVLITYPVELENCDVYLQYVPITHLDYGSITAAADIDVDDGTIDTIDNEDIIDNGLIINNSEYDDTIHSVRLIKNVFCGITCCH